MCSVCDSPLMTATEKYIKYLKSDSIWDKVWLWHNSSIFRQPRL